MIISQDNIVNIEDYDYGKQLIGSGSFSRLYTGINRKTNEKCMIKISTQEDQPDFKNENIAIYREMNILSKIKHPAIAKFIGYSPFDFDHQLRPVIITEFCENGTLKSFLNSPKALQSLDALIILKILYDISSGMSFLHSHDILHRNLTLESIYLDKSFNPKISDFSLAVYSDSNTRTTEGTPIYMAPEILLNNEYTAKSDIFAFGMIAYQLLTKKVPFGETKSPLTVMMKIARGEKPNLDDNQIPESFKKLISDCWSFDPNKRPSFDQIKEIFKTDSGFITDKKDKELFDDYVNRFDNSKVDFNSEKNIVIIPDETINQPINEELIELFKRDPQKVKYFLILEAKQEISHLSCHYTYNEDLNISIDLDALKSTISKKYEILMDQIGLQKVQEVHDDNQLSDIMSTIDYEYNKLMDQIKTKSICSSSLSVLNQVIKVLNTNPIDFNQIEKILDESPEKLLFDKEKLRQIPSLKTNVSEILLTLNAIKQNPNFKNPLLNELPKLSILHSPSNKASSSLANVLSGNCFFITLYGKQTTMDHVLSSLSFNEIERHQMNDAISIYGPLDFVSFAKTVPSSLDMLKYFNGNFPNLYFFEISSELNDNITKDWCEFILFISHYLIFCSETNPTNNDIKYLVKSNLLSYFKGSLINCSPPSNTPLKFGKMNPNFEIDINSLNDNHLLSYLFSGIFNARFDFIPCETATSLSQVIIGDKNKEVLSKIEKSIGDKIKSDYSHQIHYKSIQYFHSLVQEMFDKTASNVEIGKYVYDFHLNDLLSVLIDKTQEYLYTNMSSEFWNKDYIVVVSKILNSEVKNNFESSFLQIRQIEAFGKLIKIYSNVDDDDNDDDDDNNDVTEISKNKEIIEIIKSFDSSFDLNKLSKDEIVSKSKKAYDDIASLIKENLNLKTIVKSFVNELYSFLDKNPTASDSEYSSYYQELYNRYNSTKETNIEKYIDITLNIRKVLFEYRPKKFRIEINQESFQRADIELKSNSLEITMASKMTCHEFFQLIEDKFKLKNIPFHITQISNNHFNQPFEIEVINDNANLSLLNSYNFTVYYGRRIYSTQILIESLIIQNTIKIADDFVIKANSKDADFKVHFPPDHKGWFGVEFDILNVSKKINENDYALIYLTLTADEISFLQEGNLLFHQTYKDGEWVNEKDPVYLSFPNCKTAVFPLLHCSKHRVVKEKLKTGDSKDKKEGKRFYLPNIFSIFKPKKKVNDEDEEIRKLLDKSFSRNWENENGDIKYNRGGRPYYLPVGYLSEGIKVDGSKLPLFDTTCVGFHATKATVLFKIIKEGFKLPSELAGVREGHIPLNDQSPLMKCDY